MDFNEKIDLFMKENNIKDLKQLSTKADIPYTTLRDFYNKRSADNSRLSTIRKLSEYMQCSLDYLAFDENLKFDNAISVNISNDCIKIPVLGIIKAGTPIEAQENIIDYIEIPLNWTAGNKKYYGLKIDGDSMYPKYQKNDVVIFEQIDDYSKANKKDCAVMVNGFDATFKNVTISEDGITLVPLNLNNSENYQPTFYNKNQIESLPVKIIGIAREKRTKID